MRRLRQSVFHFNDNLFPRLLATRAAEGNKGEAGQHNNSRELHWNPVSQRFTTKHGPSGTQYQPPLACEAELELPSLPVSAAKTCG